MYIFPGPVHIFGCSRIGRLIVGINKSLTDTWMWKSGLRPRNYFSGNICFEFRYYVFAVCKSVPCLPCRRSGGQMRGCRWGSWLQLPPAKRPEPNIGGCVSYKLTLLCPGILLYLSLFSLILPLTLKILLVFCSRGPISYFGPISFFTAVVRIVLLPPPPPHPQADMQAKPLPSTQREERLWKRKGKNPLWLVQTRLDLIHTRLDFINIWLVLSRVVWASDSQCQSRNCTGFDPSILR